MRLIRSSDQSPDLKKRKSRALLIFFVLPILVTTGLFVLHLGAIEIRKQIPSDKLFTDEYICPRTGPSGAMPAEGYGRGRGCEQKKSSLGKTLDIPKYAFGVSLLLVIPVMIIGGIRIFVMDERRDKPQSKKRN